MLKSPNWKKFKYIVDFGGIVVIANSLFDLAGKMTKIDNGDMRGFFRTDKLPIELSEELKSREVENKNNRDINIIVYKLNQISERKIHNQFETAQARYVENMRRMGKDTSLGFLSKSR